MNQLLKLTAVALLATVCRYGVSLAHAQGETTGRIEGLIENRDTGAYLGTARIRVEGTRLETFSDAHGEYRLAGVSPGVVQLDIFYTGLEPETVTVTVRAGEVVHADANLGSASALSGTKATKMDAFVVAAEREKDAKEMAINERRFAPNIKNVVAADQFGNVNDGNIGEFLKFLPGVSVGYSAWDPATVSLRGMPSADTLLTVDGFEPGNSASGQSRGAYILGISMDNISRVEVVKSPTPDLPANALGGSVNVITLNAFERRTVASHANSGGFYRDKTGSKLRRSSAPA